MSTLECFSEIKLNSKFVNWGAKDSPWPEIITSEWRRGLSVLILREVGVLGNKISSQRSSANIRRRIIALALQNNSQKDFCFLVFVSNPKKKIGITTVDNIKHQIDILIRSINLGILPDTPNITKKLSAAYKFEVPKELVAPAKKFPPLADEFVSNFGYRCFWILENWLDPMSKFLGAWSEQSKEGGQLDGVKWDTRLLKPVSNRFRVTGEVQYSLPKEREKTLSFLQKHFSEEQNLFPLPDFPIEIKSIGNSGYGGSFTPGGDNSLFSTEGVLTGSSESILSNGNFAFSGIPFQFQMIQSALYFITGLISGPRISEIRTLSSEKPVHIFDTHSVYFSHTFKLCPDDKGVSRPWIIPERNARWIQTFYDMRSHSTIFMIGFNPDSFWVSRRFADKQIQGNTLVKWVRELAKMFGLTDITLDSDYSDFINHSFRKTIARYIAIAMVGGHKYLFDMFGHKWFEMTLHYIHSDGIQQTIRTVQSELEAIGFNEQGPESEANAEFAELVEQERVEIVLDKYLDILSDMGAKYHGGGPEYLRMRASEITPIVSNKLTDAQVRELSANGSSFIQVTRGVSCLKGAKSRGLCNDGAAATDINPNKCSPECHFHVAESGRILALEKSIRLGISEIESILEGLGSTETVRDHAGKLRQCSLGILNAVNWLKKYNAPLPTYCDHQLVVELLKADGRGNFMEVFGYEH